MPVSVTGTGVAVRLAPDEEASGDLIDLLADLRHAGVSLSVGRC